jgi:hypothetical protein
LALGVIEAMARVTRWRAWTGPLLVVLLLAFNALFSWQAYFGAWAGAPEVRELYQGGITAVARELDARDPSGPVAVGAPYIDFWNPWNAVGFDLALRRDDLDGRDATTVRWFNPAGGWVWPAGSGPTTFYFPVDPLGPIKFDSGLQSLFFADAIALPATDDDFDAFTVIYPDSLERRLQELLDTPVAWPPEFADLSPPALPLVFSDRFALLGTELQSVPESGDSAESEDSAVSPGDVVRLVTYWEVLAADPSPVVAFVHLTSDGRDIWGQHDGLDVRPIGLLPGDRFAQIHALVVKPETLPGTYALQVGLYGPDSLLRLPILSADGGPVDRVWVAELEVTAP